jgi:hypothetical protein
MLEEWAYRARGVRWVARELTGVILYALLKRALTEIERAYPQPHPRRQLIDLWVRP